MKENLSPLDYMTVVRRGELLPKQVISYAGRQYADTWKPGASRSIESSESYEYLSGALWYRNENKKIRVLDILPQRIEEIRKTGRPFRIMDVGGGSSAQFVTGKHEFRGEWTDNQGLIKTLTSWGFKVGRDVELIAVHGGEFNIAEQNGLRLITANIFNGIPGVSEQSIDLLTSFRTTYHTPGSLYLLELFDRFLYRGRTPGLAIVWPYNEDSIFFADAENRIMQAYPAFTITGVDYWHPGEHVGWVAHKEFLTFPVDPVAIVKERFITRLFYKIQPEALTRYVHKGGRIPYPEFKYFADGTIPTTATWI